ncbi:hypothetical protein LTR50_006268 [Elasticomyces elasticus]|nr:hypothetical protein LTR50_006268 [Elasticomyces elasticus]
MISFHPRHEYRDADARQSSYSENHNMDPAVVDSAQFGLLWKTPFNNLEQFYAKPLVFTPQGQDQLVFLASSQNWIRTLNAKTGQLLNSRQVQKPFLQSDIGCTDIPNTIGITGTPVIDPATEIAYFYAKTYIPNYRSVGNTGVYNGAYYFYAVDINTLQDVNGFPILVDGVPADNDPRKYFIGATVLQRPSLIQINNFIYAGFGGHCDLYNYTGTVLGVDIVQKEIITNWAVESGPNSRFSTTWQTNGAGGQGGIWQSGMGLSSDGQRFFVATGNGQGGENQGIPASGQSGCRTLGEAVINLGVDSSTGKISLIDYFQPYDYINMDGGDQDFGSGGVSLLDPTVFKGTGVSRLAVTTGKNGKIYIMNADNLGGYKQGPGQTDLVVQEIITNRAVFGGIGSYPLEGGYIYSTPVGYPTSVYKLGFNGGGAPVFTLVGATTETSAGRVGPGIPTITTYKGQAGTAILWSTDPDAGLRAWYAVPNADGSMKRINLPQVGGNNKFQRPVFGDTRLYVTDANGVFYCLGSPVNLPLNCSSPVSFGNVVLGSKSVVTINCTALIDIASIDSVAVGDAYFEVNATSLPKGRVASGSSFSFPVTWNLSNVTVKNAVNASYGNITPGIKSTALTIGTTNAIPGYSTSFPISLTGTEVSRNAFLNLAPLTVDFGGLVLGVSGGSLSSTLSFTIANLGSAPMTMLGYSYTKDGVGDSSIAFTNSTNNAGTWDLGMGFTSDSLPAVGSVLQAGQSLSVPTTFSAVNGTGSYLSYFYVWSNGGSRSIILEGSASTAPKANFSISTSEGGWLPESNLLMDFGSAAPGDTLTRQIRICNEGGSVLKISKSKPPLGDIRTLHYNQDLAEELEIPVNTCSYGTVVFNPSQEPPNVPDYTATNQWTLNTDDQTFGVHVVQIQGVVHDRVVGPTFSNGIPQFLYLGCYMDNAAGYRLLPNEAYADPANNTNGECQAACLARGYAFAGTEYMQECWCGNKLPSGTYYYSESDKRCTFQCPGDGTQACGGNGGSGYISVYYDQNKYTVTNSTFQPSSDPVSTGPAAAPSSGPYSYIGCFSEATNGRALTGLAVPAPSNGGSVEYCESVCSQSSYTYFGVEYSNEWYVHTLLWSSRRISPRLKALRN